MARRVNGLSISWPLASIGTLLNGKSIIGMHAWVKFASFGAGGNGNRIISIIIDLNGSGLILNVDTTSLTARVVCSARSIDSESLQRAAATVGVVSTTAWHSIGAVVNYPADTIALYLDGVLLNTISVAFTNNSFTMGTPSALNYDAFGSYTGTVTDAINGDIAEVAFWSATPDFEALAAGVVADQVNLGSLIDYYPLYGHPTQEIGLFSGNRSVSIGSSIVSTHCRSVGWRGPRQFVTTAGGLLVPNSSRFNALFNSSFNTGFN